MSCSIKELSEEFEDDRECLGENTEKYITFSVPIQKENKRMVKKRKPIKLETIIYKAKFIDSIGFMNSSLTSLVDNPFYKNDFKSGLSGGMT